METVLRKKFPRGLNNFRSARVCFSIPVEDQRGVRVGTPFFTMLHQFVPTIFFPA
ncbi:hypothetical protein QP166_01375 [Sphingomonas sp. LR60]|uniref:hypothetical protein n=1 Tax=Sphingomonas sp. LR60 TaxID=3050233 RepID=UPI002FE2F093